MNIKEILKDYISYNWIEELITDEQKNDLEKQLDLYVSGNSLLNLCDVGSCLSNEKETILRDFDNNEVWSLDLNTFVSKQRELFLKHSTPLKYTDLKRRS